MEESGEVNSAVIDKYSQPATIVIKQPLAGQQMVWMYMVDK
jgi:hypothetical protein